METNIQQKLQRTYSPTQQEMAVARQEIVSKNVQEWRKTGRWKIYVDKASELSRDRGILSTPISTREIQFALAQADITNEQAREYAQQKRIGKYASMIEKVPPELYPLVFALNDLAETFAPPNFPSVEYNLQTQMNRVQDCLWLVLQIAESFVADEDLLDKAIRWYSTIYKIDQLSVNPPFERDQIRTAVFQALFFNIPITLFNFECFDIFYDKQLGLQIGFQDSKYYIFSPKRCNKELQLLSIFRRNIVPVQLCKIFVDEEVPLVYPELVNSTEKDTTFREQLKALIERSSQEALNRFGESVKVLVMSNIIAQATKELYDSVYNAIMASFDKSASPLVQATAFQTDLRFRIEKNKCSIGLPQDEARDLFMTQQNYALYAAELACVRAVFPNVILLLNEPDVTIPRFNTLAKFDPNQPKLPVLFIF
jgi:hypothetical protein